MTSSQGINLRFTESYIYISRNETALRNDSSKKKGGGRTSDS
jgi:hypothetical protein